MIQLSILPANIAENPVKPRLPQLLRAFLRQCCWARRMGPNRQAAQILPEGGKILPDALPAEELALQVFRNRCAPLVRKLAAKAETGGAEV